MKDFLNKPASITKMEFWAATTIFVFAVFFLTTFDRDENQYFFNQTRTPFEFYENYFFPQLIQYIVLFAAFWVLNFKIFPDLQQKENIWVNITYIVLIFVAIGLTFGITDTYYKNYLFNEGEKTEQQTYNSIFLQSFLFAAWSLFMFGLYTAIKHAALYLLANSEAIESKYRITRDGLIALVLWMISMFLLLLADAEGELILGWGIVIPFGILFYCYSLYTLIPKALSKKKPFRAYVLKSILLLALAFLPVAIIGFLITRHDELGFIISIFNTTTQLFITVPLSWIVFKRQMRGNEEIYVLKKELGRSNANLDFLRSQINPHFLFNALNTIYGTAIQEKAERTSEGIEKLGDMMRFMLQENMQEKISLAREIDYLNNYISLQKLRTDPNPGISIQTAIEDQVHTIQIAPMLLIPFVENAFKHGISFRESSHIKITLEIRENTLNFDVYNSKHDKPENDPEKNKSGIGLNNVKQRLQHIYPNKHELIIRETGKEFFVHLTVKLA